MSCQELFTTFLSLEKAQPANRCSGAGSREIVPRTAVFRRFSPHLLRHPLRIARRLPATSRKIGGNSHGAQASSACQCSPTMRRDLCRSHIEQVREQDRLPSKYRYGAGHFSHDCLALRPRTRRTERSGSGSPMARTIHDPPSGGYHRLRFEALVKGRPFWAGVNFRLSVRSSLTDTSRRRGRGLHAKPALGSSGAKLLRVLEGR